MSAFFCFSFDPPTLADVLSQLDPPRLDKNTLAFPKCNHRVSVCRVCSRLQPKHKSILMLENVKCGSHQKNGISLLGPENTKSDILKRTSKLARHPPPPCPHFSAFQVPPSPPSRADVLYVWPLMILGRRKQFRLMARAGGDAKLSRWKRGRDSGGGGVDGIICSRRRRHRKFLHQRG